jgi:hypothetical protein
LLDPTFERGELTRIEMRIDRLLKRYEIGGFEATAPRPGQTQQPQRPLQPGEPEPPPPPKPAPPMFGRDGRPPRRIRRAL